MNIIKSTLTLFVIFILPGCQSKLEQSKEIETNLIQINKTLETLLDAIERKDINALKSAMSPSEKMEFIVPSTPVTYSVESFVNFHDEWFKDTTWTIETNILNVKPGLTIATATTEAIYREAERNGRPYMNHMIVSYVLEKNQDNTWSIIKDHASSLKRTGE